GYVTGLEPGTNYPNRRSFEKLRKRVVSLPPGAAHAVDLALEFHPDPASVPRAEAAVARTAPGRAPPPGTRADRKSPPRGGGSRRAPATRAAAGSGRVAPRRSWP